MVLFPGSLDTSASLPNPAVTDKSNNPSHSALHTAENAAIIAVEAKVGTGASTPTANTLMFGTGTGTSAWTSLTSAQLAANLTDESGTGSAVFANTPTLITPKMDTLTESTPSNGVTIAGLNIKSGVLNTNNSVVTANITDANVTTAKLAANAVTLAKLDTGVGNGWFSITGGISAVTYNGNRSYSLTALADNTTLASPGMRLKTTRTVAAPTQCTSLNGTTQYYSKTSPAGMTFTNNFVVSAWVKLTSYAHATIASRYNGTSGWSFEIASTGQPVLVGLNAGSANFSQILAYQSLPLNKWVHVTAQLDMATFTATPTTSYIMIDGVDVPAAVFRGGTSPTALIQAGNLEIGSLNGGTNPWPGKIAQVAIYNAKVTQANVRATISQTLAGTETSLISAYSFNNSINDLNANANNLTANGSAVATNADSPFGGQAGGTISSTLDYGIIQTISATTIVTQVPEGCTIPTTGGVSAVSYASVSKPYGFPGQEGKWKIQAKYKSTTLTTINTTTAQLTGAQITTPIGSWVIGFKAHMITSTGATTFINTIFGLSSSTSAFDGALDDAKVMSTVISSSATELDSRLIGESDYDTASQVPIYVLGKTPGNYSVGFDGASVPGIIYLKNAYL